MKVWVIVYALFAIGLVGALPRAAFAQGYTGGT